MAQRRGGPLVPTISVTPHSPSSRHYPVLEDNLLQLHELHESIQQMRDISAQIFCNQVLGQFSRLSTSCPSLNNDAGSDPDLLGSLTGSPSRAVPMRSLNAPDMADIMHKKGSMDEWLLGAGDGVPRRRSWTGSDGLGLGSEKGSGRQRSMSLSSLDSEPEDSFVEQVDGVVSSAGGSTGCLDPPSATRATRTPRTSAGATSSTHSLNEAELQHDFIKIVAKREAENLRLPPVRLPLQKSVSTPSIIAVRDLGNDNNVDVPGSVIPPLRPSGTESETEEEGLQGKNYHLPLDDFLNVNVYDPRVEKRRKRGSIFFRKKKDKTKKVTHHWIMYSGPVHHCDWCSKPVQNSALFCDNCSSVVHSSSCKDHITDCNKSKPSKSSSKTFAVSSKFSTSKRNSSSGPAHPQNTSNNSQIISEEREADGSHHETVNFSDDISGVQFEFMDEGQVTASDLDTDPFLGLQDEEPDSWTPFVGKEVTKKLKEKEIKRQEHIYEFILTEKHHCLTLRVMQKVFVNGLQRHFNLGKDLERMFPRLSDLTEIHLDFLSKLRQRQKTSPVVGTICDILVDQFSGTHAQKLKSAYGEFCSRHRDAVDMYKNYLHDRRFAEFVRFCQTNPLLKKKGIPECILFVTQRLTKYPLLIEPLIKTAKDNREEQERLTKALALVKEILVEVDAQVAEKEKEDRKLEIYNRIDVKSFTVHRDSKFKKADILLKNRKLRFEGVAMLMQGRSKMQVVLVIVLSDVLFFLLENNNKYSFFTPDNKTGVVSLQKLLVREKAGQDSRGIYLISSNPAEPEMFELKVHKPKDKQVWIRAIRSAVQTCQEDDEESVVLSVEERQKLFDAKQAQIKQIVGAMRQKDCEQAQILEEKMLLQQKLLAAVGVESALNPPNYCNLATEDTDSSTIWQEVLSAVQEVNQLANSLYATGTNLSRSVSSVGEHQSEAYISPTLPKRAETFGGFDCTNKDVLANSAAKGGFKKIQQDKTRDSSASLSGTDSEKKDDTSSKASGDQAPWRNAVMATIPPVVLPSNMFNNGNDTNSPTLAVIGQEQQAAAVQLSNYFYKLLSIIHQQMTTVHSLQAQLGAYRLQLSQDDRERRPVYKHNQQLEELRNLQDRLTQERELWQRERETEEREIEEKKQELLRLQEQVRAEQNDVTQQREQLYRKMEVLTSQGILISPNMPVVTNVASSDIHIGSGLLKSTEEQNQTAGENTSPSTSEVRRKNEKWKGGSSNKSSLPLNLISATNQQKVAQGVKIKQQLPFKLASKLGESTSNSNPNIGSSSTAGSNNASGSASNSGVQQILPFKLSQTTESRRSSGGSSGYQRLGSGSFSPPSSVHKVEDNLIHSHTRTGSSPAMMQNIAPVGPDGKTVQRNKADRTNTYPKLPDRFRVQPADSGSSHPTQSGEEEVIFF